MRQIPIRHAFSLVEALVSIAIVGILLAILAPAINAARTRSLQSQCEKNLRDLTIGALSYESANRHLPPGVLGVANAFEFGGNFLEPSSELFWANYQYTSSLALVLPFLEEQPLYSKYDAAAYNVGANFRQLQVDVDWYGDLSGFSLLTGSPPKMYQCPLDRQPRQDIGGQVFGAVQPVYSTPHNSDAIAWVDQTPYGTEFSYAMSNYAGVVGAHSGGEYRDLERRGATGLMSTRKKRRIATIRDGMSRTVMYGETIGEMSGGDRVNVVSWLTGAICRMRGPVPWNKEPDVSEAMLGDADSSYWYGFGSMHRNSVPFSFGDGHVQQMSRSSDWRVLYALAGIANGRTAKMISVVIPTLREARNLREVSIAIDAALRSEDYEIVFVDDNSKDGSAEIASELSNMLPVRMMTRTGSPDLCAAVKEGIASTKGEFIVVMDADLSHPAVVIPQMIESLKNDADFCIASRFIRGASVDWGGHRFRPFISKVACFLANAAIGQDVTDPMSGFFALRRSDFPDPQRLRARGFKIALDILAKGEFRRVSEFPIHFLERRYGNSKLSAHQFAAFAFQLCNLFANRLSIPYRAQSNPAERF